MCVSPPPQQGHHRALLMLGCVSPEGPWTHQGQRKPHGHGHGHVQPGGKRGDPAPDSRPCSRAPGGTRSAQPKAPRDGGGGSPRGAETRGGTARGTREAQARPIHRPRGSAVVRPPQRPKNPPTATELLLKRQYWSVNTHRINIRLCLHHQMVVFGFGFKSQLTHSAFPRRLRSRQRNSF